MLGQLGVLIRENQSSEGVRLLQTALRRPHLLQLLSEMFMPSATAPVYFLDMYRFVVDSHMQKSDTKILFVLLSKVEWIDGIYYILIEICEILRCCRRLLIIYIQFVHICSLMWPSGW